MSLTSNKIAWIACVLIVFQVGKLILGFSKCAIEVHFMQGVFYHTHGCVTVVPVNLLHAFSPLPNEGVNVLFFSVVIITRKY